MTGAGYRKVLVTSGHMIDAPGRSQPRFPAELEPVVAAEIERVLDEWHIGPGDLLLNGGARGADILFAESAHRRGCDVEFILARPVPEFERSSVELPRSIWGPRFRYLLAHHPHRISRSNGGDGAVNDFARANLDLLRRARQLVPPARPHVALVWDRKPAGGEGGTGEFAELAYELRAPLVIIDPNEL